MDVYLIPTATSERYELYYEAPDEEPMQTDSNSLLNRLTFGLSDRLKRKFDDMLVEACRWQSKWRAAGEFASLRSVRPLPASLRSSPGHPAGFRGRRRRN